MADRAFLIRLETSEGPSHHLLVLLDQHRVMTTGQLARATGAPERTVRSRLERLREAGLVDFVHPGRERGSAPRYWSLRRAGARLIAGSAPSSGTPSAMFAVHAAAITEVWLALTARGPSVGLQPVAWQADRAGWQEWESTGRYGSGSRRKRLTPDAVATIALAGGLTAAAFVEVDLASMTQTLLRHKVDNYLAYARDHAWQGVHPHCPPLLLLTTTTTRAVTFARACRPLLDQHHKHHGSNDPAEALVIAACGLVHDPAPAITEPCWILPERAAAEVTLAEICTERAEAQAVSDAWHAANDARLARRADLDELTGAARIRDLAGSHVAAEALRHLIDGDPARLYDTEPDLARQIIDWLRLCRRVDRWDAKDAAQPLIATLEARHAAVWADQARRLLAALDQLAADLPHTAQIAEVLADGHLATPAAIDALDSPPAQTRQQLQDAAIGDYFTRRDAELAADRKAMRWRDRRKVSLEQLTAAHDDEHLLICGTCRLVYLHDNHHWHCRHCHTDLLDWPDRHQAVPLPERLESIKRRLVEQAAQAGGHTAATSSRTSAAHPHDRETPAPPCP